jgi:hypothetical protein
MSEQFDFDGSDMDDGEQNSIQLNAEQNVNGENQDN